MLVEELTCEYEDLPISMENLLPGMFLLRRRRFWVSPTSQYSPQLQDKGTLAFPQKSLLKHPGPFK